jgi:hypothetical protein
MDAAAKGYVPVRVGTGGIGEIAIQAGFGERLAAAVSLAVRMRIFARGGGHRVDEELILDSGIGHRSPRATSSSEGK